MPPDLKNCEFGSKSWFVERISAPEMQTWGRNCLKIGGWYLRWSDGWSGGWFGGPNRGSLWGSLWRSLCRKLNKICKMSSQKLLRNQMHGKMQQVCMEPPRQPPKSVFRLHETTVFANATGPSKLRGWPKKLVYWSHFGARNADLGSKLSQNWWVIREVIRWVIGRVIP